MFIEDIKKAMQFDEEGLRRFGLTMGALLTVLGTVVFFRKHSSSYNIIFMLSAIFISIGLLLPKWLSPIYRCCMIFGAAMGWLMSRAILVVVYYIVVTPIGLIMRACSRDTMRHGFGKDVQSYWVPKIYAADGNKRYEDQF